MIRLHSSVLATSIVLSSLASPAEARSRQYDIPPGSLKSALDAYVRQSGQQIFYRADEVRLAKSRGVRGQYAPEVALRVLLSGSGFSTRADGDLIAIVQASADDQTADGNSTSDMQGDVTQSAASNDGAEILVTGSRIRGGSAASPIITLGAEQLREEGFSNLGEAIRSVPQNFAGGQNPGVSSGNISGAGLANQNLTGGSGLNLRGLGPDATLTLLNGRRLAYGGFVQSVDISAIPIDAVRRVEIVPDGASAIYGSDAVGGVGNVILKRDFDGVMVRGRVGSATDGGLATREYAGTAGTTWSTGGIIAAYQDASVDPIYARQRDYADFLIHPTTLYPQSHTRSGVVSVHQALGDVVSLKVNGLRSERDQSYHYFVNGTNDISSETNSSYLAADIDVSLPDNWTLTIGTAWGKDDHFQYQERTNLTSGVVTIVSNNLYSNETSTYEASAEGPLFTSFGGEARLAVGGGYRSVEFLWRNRGTGIAALDGKESAKYVYAELNLPLVGPGNEVDGIRRLSLTAAIRGEDYESFGRVATPKVGITYEPVMGMTLKASWGKSFKAPTLLQRFQRRDAVLYRPTQLGGVGFPSDSTVLVDSGGNPELKPERAETWSASIALQPDQVPGLQMELTGFKVSFVDRVVQPIANPVQALANPIYSPFINYLPSDADKAALLASVAGFTNTVNEPYDPSKVAAIIDLRYLNAAQQDVKGLDFSGSYRMELPGGALTFRGSLSWLDSSQQVGPAQSPYDLAGTLFNPPNFTSRLGSVLDHAGFTIATFLNYKSGIRDTVRNEKTASFATVDATVNYETGNGRGILSGLNIALSIQNLFDRSPLLYRPISNAAFAVPYDSTNYSPIGRFVSLAISKRF